MYFINIDALLYALNEMPYIEKVYNGFLVFYNS